MNPSLIRLERIKMQDSFDKLKQLMGSEAAADLLHEFVASASGRPLPTISQQFSASAPAPEMCDASSQAAVPPKKQPRKRSIAKRMQRLTGAIERLQREAAAPADASAPASTEEFVESHEDPTELHEPAVPLAAGHATNVPPPSESLATVDGASGAKRSTNEAPPLSPFRTPTRVPSSGKKPRNTHPTQHHTTLFPISMTSPAGKQRQGYKPSTVAAMAKEHGMGFIAASEWYWLANPIYSHTYQCALNLLKVELVGTDVREWDKVCDGAGPHIMYTQCVRDGLMGALGGK